jgi:hypothetical protein
MLLPVICLMFHVEHVEGAEYTQNAENANADFG